MALALLGLGATATAVGATPTEPSHGAASHIALKPARPGESLIRSIQWAGRRWWVYGVNQPGPEGVKLTNDQRAVYVDGRGRLHLNIIKINGKWRSVELRTVNTVSYGTFRLINDTRTARFSDRTVFGMFVYRPGASKNHGGHEIDIENSRFPNYLKAPNNAQFAVQPYNKPHHEHAYHVKRSDVPLLQQFIWYPPIKGKGTVKFLTRVGTTTHSPLLAHWTYHGSSDPTNQNMYIYLTLWLNHGKPPKGGTHSAVLRSLTYTRL
ncbi:MAG TPA: glycoside hydrolase family 16 protein [Mycobacteriales bacterium]|nr:glycoside hydrolase family 16 protein [Mycobacteriales bacterium]